MADSGYITADTGNLTCAVTNGWRNVYLDIEKSDDGKAITGIYVTLRNCVSVLFRTPAMRYTGKCPHHYEGTRNSRRRMVICRDEKSLFALVERWLTANKVDMTITGKNDSCVLLAERINAYGIKTDPRRQNARPTSAATTRIDGYVLNYAHFDNIYTHFDNIHVTDVGTITMRL